MLTTKGHVQRMAALMVARLPLADLPLPVKPPDVRVVLRELLQIPCWVLLDVEAPFGFLWRSNYHLTE